MEKTSLRTPSLFLQTTQSLLSSTNTRQCCTSNVPTGTSSLRGLTYSGGEGPNLGISMMFRASSSLNCFRSYVAGRRSCSVSGNILRCSVKRIKALTPAVSIASKKNRFPPSHALSVHTLDSHDLIRSIYGIHEAIVILKYLWLVKSSIWVPNTSNFCLTGDLNLVVCNGRCAYHI